MTLTLETRRRLTIDRRGNCRVQVVRRWTWTVEPRPDVPKGS